MTNMRMRSSSIITIKIEATARVSRIRVECLRMVSIIIGAPDKWRKIKMNSEIMRINKVEISITYLEIKISENSENKIFFSVHRLIYTRNCIRKIGFAFTHRDRDVH